LSLANGLTALGNWMVSAYNMTAQSVLLLMALAEILVSRLLKNKIRQITFLKL
jgi:hypothetical protein